MPLDPTRLSPRDARVLAVFRRHPAADRDGVRRLAGLTDMTDDALGKVLRRLVFAGWLEGHPLPDGSVCYLLTRRAAVALGAPRRRRQGLSQEGAVQHLGTLRLCLSQNVTKLSAAELKAELPHLLHRGLPATGYGVDPDGRLLWLIIDHKTKPARLAAKAAEAVAKREWRPAFAELIDVDGLGVLVGVPTAVKAAEVEAALAALKTPVNPLVPVRATVVPGLASLLLEGD